jgi:hypothetical protein
MITNESTHGQLLWANLKIDCDEVPIEKLADYVAVEYYLTIDEPPPDASNLDKIRCYLEAFYHLCKVENWQKAKEVFFTRLNTPTKEELHNQLSNWGYHRELIDLYNKLVDKLSPNLNASCWNGMGRSYFFWEILLMLLIATNIV